MGSPSHFPDFKRFELDDREFIQGILNDYQPEISEMTFTNLFMWRHHHGTEWCMYKDWLLVLGVSDNYECYAFPPIGPGDRKEVAVMLLEWLDEMKQRGIPTIERADARLVAELDGEGKMVAEESRDHFDYVYGREDLAALSGRKYHSKRNFVNTFLRSYSFSYETLTEEHVPECLELAGKWCKMRACEEDMNLMGEWRAIHEALPHFRTLGLRGGVVRVGKTVEAFTLGEFLNKETAVVHIEKANPELRGLYALINQQFCENEWADATYINREQDLGEPGLRKAKLSYHPVRLVEKYRIRLNR